MLVRLQAMLLSLALAACGSLGFHGTDLQPKHPAASEQQTKPNIELDSGSGKQQSAGTSAEASPYYRPQDDEDERADKPVQVAGAFLACASMRLPGLSSYDAAFGCAVVKDGKKVELTRHKVKWAVKWAAKSGQVGFASDYVDMQPLADTSPWHMQVRTDKRTAASLVVMADVNWADDAQTAADHLEARLANLPEGLNFRFGEQSDFHLGNGAFASSSCQTKLYAIPISGVRLTMPIEVKSDATVLTFTMTEICGIDAAKPNFVSIIQNGEVVRKFQLDHNVGSLVIGGVNLAAGPAILQIDSLIDEVGDRDDFVIGEVFVSATKPVSVSTFHVSNDFGGWAP